MSCWITYEPFIPCYSAIYYVHTILTSYELPKKASQQDESIARQSLPLHLPVYSWVKRSNVLKDIGVMTVACRGQAVKCTGLKLWCF